MIVKKIYNNYQKGCDETLFIHDPQRMNPVDDFLYFCIFEFSITEMFQLRVVRIFLSFMFVKGQT